MIVISLVVSFILYFRIDDRKIRKRRFVLDNIYEENNYINIDSKEKEELLSYIEGTPTFELTPLYNTKIKAISYCGIPASTSPIIIELNEDLINKYKIIENIPKSDDEILITKHDYMYFEKYGFINEDGCIREINKIEDIIGVELYDSRVYFDYFENHWIFFKIVGVIETGFNENLVRGIYFFDDHKLSGSNYYIKHGLSNSIHIMIFLKEGYHKRSELNPSIVSSLIYPTENFNETQLII